MDAPINTTGEDKYFHTNEYYKPANLNSKNYPNLGPYPNREVISALRKEIKLGRTENAIYWLTVVLEYGDWSAKDYLARQLWIIAAEDMFDQMIVLQAAAVLQNHKICGETDHFYNLVYHMCKAPKIHNSEGGVEMDRLWGEAQGKLRRGAYLEIPSYAVDRHTYRGKVAIAKGLKTDERFSGTVYGRYATQYLYKRDGDKFGPKSLLDSQFEKEMAEINDTFGENLPKRITNAEQAELL